MISGGDIFGTVYENELISKHKIMCPPNVYGMFLVVALLFRGLLGLAGSLPGFR